MSTQQVFQKRGRDRLSIVAEILDITLDGSPKTQIMYRASLSFTQLHSYLSLLLECKLIERILTEEKLLFKTTPKGMWFLKAHREIEELLTPESVEEAIGKPSVVAIIPAYNEEKKIAEAILKTRNQVDRVIVCDDGSIDMTREIAERMGARVVRHKVSEGKGAALRSLFQESKDLDADVVVILDADEQCGSDEIEKLIQPILSGQVDFVIGAKASKDAVKRNRPMFRRLGSKAVNKLLSVLTGTKLSDTQGCARAVSRRVIESLVISEKGANFDVEMLMQAYKKGWVVAEVPAECNYPGK